MSLDNIMETLKACTQMGVYGQQLTLGPEISKVWRTLNISAGAPELGKPQTRFRV